MATEQKPLPWRNNKMYKKQELEQALEKVSKAIDADNATMEIVAQASKKLCEEDFNKFCNRLNLTKKWVKEIKKYREANQ